MIFSFREKVYGVNKNLYDRALFEPLTLEEKRDAEVLRPSKSYWQDVWTRLKSDKLALFGLVVIILILLLAIFGPDTTISFSPA